MSGCHDESEKVVSTATVTSTTHSPSTAASAASAATIFTTTTTTTTKNEDSNTKNEAASEDVVEDSVALAVQRSSVDRGHRLGNFRNYYHFHPSVERLDALERSGVFDAVVETFVDGRDRKRRRAGDNGPTTTTRTLTHCDLGCNEGDMTLGVARRLAAAYRRVVRDEDGEDNRSSLLLRVEGLGLDVDRVLIDRARKRERKPGDDDDASTTKSTTTTTTTTFRASNLCDAEDHDGENRRFLSSRSRDRFDLTTVFSTTMWVHVHAGDDGLRAFLTRACDASETILVEPQSSKSYRNVNTRLRKMKLPEIPSIPKLALRNNVEARIDQIVVSRGFQRVQLLDDARNTSSLPLSTSAKAEDSDVRGRRKSGFCRSMMLYKRRS